MDIIEETFPETNQHEIVIEKLLGKRLQNDKVEYLVKWIGKENSWELAEELDCARLIEEFEKEFRKKQTEVTKHILESEKVFTARQGFSRELEPEQIIGCTDNVGYLQFLIKWKGIDRADLMCAKEAKERYPKIVFEFHRERLSWTQDS